MESQGNRGKKKFTTPKKVTLGSRKRPTHKGFRARISVAIPSASWKSSSASILTEDQLKALGRYPRKKMQGVWLTVCDGASNITQKRVDLSGTKRIRFTVKHKFRPSEVRNLYFHNIEFRETFSQSDYVWVDGYVCLYNEEYLECHDGKIHIKEEFKDIITQYCISVGYRYILDARGRRLASVTVRSAPKQVKKNPTSMRSFIESDGPSCYYTYGEALAEYMEKKSYNDYDMEDLTYISSKSFERYRKNQNCPALAYSVAICVALMLFPDQSMEMIRLSKNVIDFTTELGSAYRYIVFAAIFQGMSVHDCNELLMEEGFDPLTEEK